MSREIGGRVVRDAGQPRVVIEVRNGMVFAYQDGEVEVVIIDYDSDGVRMDDTKVDANGDRCVVRFDGKRNPQLVREAFGRFASP
jgi:flagellar basal body P-ring protein FlgI